MRICSSVIEKAGIPDHRSMFDGLGFLLLQEIFFCRVLDIRVPKLVEAENRALLVVAESRICYNADRLWFYRSLFCIRRRGLRMARKSRKHQTVTLPHLHSETAGYIRLSVTGKGGDDSIENQKKVIEAWAQENQHSSFVRIS